MFSENTCSKKKSAVEGNRKKSWSGTEAEGKMNKEAELEIRLMGIQ